MGLQQGLPFLLLSSLFLLLPSLHCGPQYSGNKYSDLDDGTLNDIFGSSLDTARYGGDDDDEWIEVPISLLPGDGDCAPLQQPRKEPQMMKLHEEFRQIEVIKATGNNKCDFYQETEGFECVPYYQCDDGTIITDGFGLIDIRFGGSDAAEPELAVLDSTDLMCPGSLDVCCKDPDFVRSTPAPFTQQEAEPEPESSEESKEDLTQGKDEPLVQIQQEDASSEGGDDGYSQQQQQVEEEVMVFQAGGSLIGAGVVLTGAHKVQDYANDPTSLVVRCGEWDTQTEGEPLAHQDRNVVHVELHPEFNKGNLVNTVALLFLESDFILADHIDTICLPDYKEKFEDREECFVKGRGKDTFGKEGEYQVVLKEVGLPIVPRDQCLDWLRATRLGRRFKLDQSFLCAGGEAGKDACRGDGGGPLVCPQRDDPSHYVQTGIVAWGIGCGEEYVPGVYTDLGEQVCWVDWAMACHNKDKHVLRYGDECNEWLRKKQQHRFPPIANIYKACDVTWPIIEPEPYSVKTKEPKTSLPEKIRTKTKTQEVTKSAGY